MSPSQAERTCGSPTENLCGLNCLPGEKRSPAGDEAVEAENMSSQPLCSRRCPAGQDGVRPCGAGRPPGTGPGVTGAFPTFCHINAFKMMIKLLLPDGNSYHS